MGKDSGQLSPAAQKIVPLVVCLVFISVGLALWIPGFLLPVLDWKAHRKWKPVPCTVVKGPHEGGSFDLVYRYEVDGESYEQTVSADLEFFGGSQARLWRMKAGSPMTCYVNPYLPREAVLERDFDPDRFFWCAPLLFVLLPLLVLGISLYRMACPPSEEDPESAPAEGALVLEPRGRAGCSLALQGCFVFMIGGIAAIIAFLPGLQDSLLLRLVYIVPLGFVVLLLLRGIFLTVLRAFNPKLVLTVTPGEGAPGREIDVRWDARGSPGGIQRFRIVLEGREEAALGKGARRTEVFSTIDVFQGGPKDFKRGSKKLRLPPDAMASLTHGYRQIVWVLRLTADVSGLPDLSEEYPYVVTLRKRGRA